MQRNSFGQFVKGSIPYNKGKKRPEFSGKNHPNYGKSPSEESRLKNRISHLGKKATEETKKKMSRSLLGKKHNISESYGKIISERNKKIGLIPPSRKGCKLTIEQREKMSKYFSMFPTNKIHGNGYKNKTERKIEMSKFLYRVWRESVFKRDNFSCVSCGVIGQKLNAHHIRQWKDCPELRYSISNGITLCVKCHRYEHSKIRLTAKPSYGVAM